MQASKQPAAGMARAQPLLLGWRGSAILASSHALLFGLMFPPVDLWFATFLAPIPLAWMAINARTGLIAAVTASGAQLLMWLWLLRWIIPVTAVGYPALALYLAVYAGVFVILLRCLQCHRLFKRLPMAVLLPIVWTAVEFFRGDVLFDGYPWYLLAHPLIEAPLLPQAADLLGTYFVSFLVAVISGALLDAALSLFGARILGRVGLTASVAFGVMVGIANALYGQWRMSQPINITRGPIVLAIQTNLPQDNKVGWDEEAQNHDVPLFIQQTQQALAGIQRANVKCDLIVWPETMVPGLGFEPDLLENLRRIELEKFYRWPDAVLALSREVQIPMLVGIETWVNSKLVPEGNRVRVEREFTYNSAVLLQGESPFQRYDKSFLTPFGETMPYISAWPWLERLLLNIGVGANLSFELDSNPDIQILRLDWKDKAGQSQQCRLATPICFEDTVARLCRRMAYDAGRKRIDAFINISNDGWFNSSVADRKLHAQIARFRCIENRVPMVRCVNTGMSVWIDSNGQLIAAAGGEGYGVTHASSYLAAQVIYDPRETWYGRVGELWPWSCLALTAVAMVWVFISNKQDRKQ